MSSKGNAQPTLCRWMVSLKCVSVSLKCVDCMWAPFLGRQDQPGLLDSPHTGEIPPQEPQLEHLRLNGMNCFESCLLFMRPIILPRLVVLCRKAFSDHTECGWGFLDQLHINKFQKVCKFSVFNARTPITEIKDGWTTSPPHCQRHVSSREVNMSISAFRRNDVCGSVCRWWLLNWGRRESLRSAESILVAVRPWVRGFCHEMRPRSRCGKV